MSGNLSNILAYLHEAQTKADYYGRPFHLVIRQGRRIEVSGEPAGRLLETVNPTPTSRGIADVLRLP